MTSKTWMIAAAALAAAGCASTDGVSAAWEPVEVEPAQFETEMDALRTDVFSLRGAEAANIQAVIAAMPEGVVFSYDDVGFDADDGAMRLTGVTITAADLPDVGLSINELRVWDLDADFAIARLNGERLDETAPLARRVQASQLSMFGLETLFSPVMEAYMGAVADGLGAAVGDDPELAELMATDILGYEFAAGSLILDDVVAHPWEMSPIATDTVEDEQIATLLGSILPFLQSYTATWRAIGVDTLAGYDLTAKMGLSDMSGVAAFDMTLDDFGYRGLRGGDLDYGVLRGFGYTYDLTPHDDSDFPVPPMKIEGSIVKLTYDEVRADNLMGFLARGEAPGRSETDLMSFGVLGYEDEEVWINGRPIYSVESAKIDLTGFHWAVPTDISYDVDNMVYNIAGVTEWILDMQQEFASEGPEFAETLNSFIGVLEDNDVETISMDFSGAWNWDPGTGATTLDAAYGLDDFMRFNMAFAGAAPDFDGVAAFVPEGALEDTDFEGIQGAFLEALALGGAEVNLVDEGGLQKGFELAVAFAQLGPDSSDNFIANATPDSLRQMASSMMFFAGASMAQEFPPAQDYISKFAAFVADGGALRLSLTPETPVGAADFAAVMSEAASEPEAGLALVDLLGVALAHDAPVSEGAEE